MNVENTPAVTVDNLGNITEANRAFLAFANPLQFDHFTHIANFFPNKADMDNITRDRNFRALKQHAIHQLRNSRDGIHPEGKTFRMIDAQRNPKAIEFIGTLNPDNTTSFTITDVTKHTIDGRTGVYNTEALHAFGSDLYYETHRKGLPIAVALFDIDHFKNFNDTHGHQTGNAVLRGLCERLSPQVRSTDIFGRYGGEEFVFLMPFEPQTSHDDIYNKLMGLHYSVFTQQISSHDVSITMGFFVSHPSQNISYEFALQFADAAMYSGKKLPHDSRNCLNELLITQDGASSTITKYNSNNTYGVIGVDDITYSLKGEKLEFTHDSYNVY